MPFRADLEWRDNLALTMFKLVSDLCLSFARSQKKLSPTTAIFATFGYFGANIGLAGSFGALLVGWVFHISACCVYQLIEIICYRRSVR